MVFEMGGCCLKIGPFLASLFFIFVFSIQLTQLKVIKICIRLDSNLGSLVSKVATLPTVPQPGLRRCTYLSILQL